MAGLWLEKTPFCRALVVIEKIEKITLLVSTDEQNRDYEYIQVIWVIKIAIFMVENDFFPQTN